MKAQPELKTNLGKSEACFFGSTLVVMHSNVSCMFFGFVSSSVSSGGGGVGVGGIG